MPSLVAEGVVAGAGGVYLNGGIQVDVCFLTICSPSVLEKIHEVKVKDEK